MPVPAFQFPIPLASATFTSKSENLSTRAKALPKRPRTKKSIRANLAFSFQPNDVIRDYKITNLLGQGTTGFTYEAVATRGPFRSQSLALKALSIRSLTTWKALDLFQREAKVLRSLSHPAIPEYVDFFQYETDADAVYVLIQKKANGKSLQDLVDEGCRFRTDEVELIFIQLLEVLSYLGSLNPPVIHRDVKPSNIIVDRTKRPLELSLVDFGAVNSGISTSGSTMVGTYGYMAPEQFAGVADVRSDLYGAATTILCVLTSQSPCTLPQKRLRIDLQAVIPARERVKLGSIYTVMSKLLEPAPEDRYDSANSALAILKGEIVDHANKKLDFIDVNTSLSAAEVASLEDALSQMNSKEPKRSALQFLAGWASSKVRRQKPAGSRVILERDNSNKLLRLSIPPKGVSRESLSQGAFTVAWTGFTAFWTIGVLTGGAPIIFSLFSLPFWAAGYRFAKSTTDEITGMTDLIISFGGDEKKVFYFGLSCKGLVWKNRLAEGDARNLDKICIETEMYVNGQAVKSMVLREGVRQHVFGQSLDAVEQKWICDEMNDFLNIGNRRNSFR